MNSKRTGSKPGLIIALIPCILASGCWIKKKQPQVAQAPVLTAPQTAPAQAQPPQQTTTNGKSGPPATTSSQSSRNKSQNPQTAHTQTKPKPQSNPVKHPKPATQKSGSSETASGKPGLSSGNSTPPGNTIALNVPPKITMQPNIADVGGAISATAPHSDDVHNNLSTDQLLLSTDDNLRSIKRTLTADEQSQVVQIRNFMAQSRSASADSDLVRARNLALKAHLLSDELVRHR